MSATETTALVEKFEEDVRLAEMLPTGMSLDELTAELVNCGKRMRTLGFGCRKSGALEKIEAKSRALEIGVELKSRFNRMQKQINLLIQEIGEVENV